MSIQAPNFNTQAIKDFFKIHPGIIIGEVGAFAVSVGSALAATSAVSLTGKVALASLSVISGFCGFAFVGIHALALGVKKVADARNRAHSRPPNALDEKTKETAQQQFISLDKSHIE
jgi:hypothetical protein